MYMYNIECIAVCILSGFNENVNKNEFDCATRFIEVRLGPGDGRLLSAARPNPVVLSSLRSLMLHQ